jgi:probable HAF family extracellular repeat protein
VLTNRSRTIVAAIFLFTLMGVAALVNIATAGKPTPPAPKAPPYSFTQLGTFGRSTYPNAINIHGDIVGFSYDAEGHSRPFLSVATAPVVSGVREIVDPNNFLLPVDQAQWVFINVEQINDNGQIVGWGLHNGVNTLFRGTLAYDDLGEPYLSLVEDVAEFIPSPLAYYGPCMIVINNAGNLAGHLQDGGVERAFLATYDPISGWSVQTFGNEWVPGTILPSRLNESNQVCGYGQPTGDNRAFRFTPGVGMKDLGFFKPWRGGFTSSHGWDMDDQGQVVGEASTSGGGYATAAFRYTDREGLVNLGTLGGSGSASANGINPSGSLIVGLAPTASGSSHLFLYDMNAKRMMDLEAAIVNLPAQYSGLGNWPTKINDAGEICGSIRTSSYSVAYVLTPVTQP